MVEGLFSSQNYQIAKIRLEAAHLRHDAFARNMANINTPGYKRVDLDPAFEVELKRAVAAGNATGSGTALRLTITEDGTAGAPRPDGNNVKLDKELIALNRNTLEYRFLTQRIDGRFKRLKAAITGNVG